MHPTRVSETMKCNRSARPRYVNDLNREPANGGLWNVLENVWIKALLRSVHLLPLHSNRQTEQRLI